MVKGERERTLPKEGPFADAEELGRFGLGLLAGEREADVLGHDLEHLVAGAVVG